MNARKSILETNWQGFEAAIIPTTAPQVQREEMKKAFFGGALVVMRVIVVIDLLSDDAVSEEAGLLILQELEEELRNFAKSLPQGNDTTKPFPWH